MNIRGNIHNMIWFWDACFGSAVGMMVIFCCTHMDTPTSSGIIIGNGLSLTRLPRSSQRNAPFTGIALWNTSKG